MNFLADMGISPKTVEFLSSLGYEAVHLDAQGLGRMKDPDIIRKAREENRVILTCDLDFGQLMAASGARLPSVIIFRLPNMSPDIVNPRLRQIISDFRDALESGAVISVSERAARIRRLPITRDEH